MDRDGVEDYFMLSTQDREERPPASTPQSARGLNNGMGQQMYHPVATKPSSVQVCANVCNYLINSFGCLSSNTCVPFSTIGWSGQRW